MYVNTNDHLNNQDEMSLGQVLIKWSSQLISSELSTASAIITLRGPF